MSFSLKPTSVPDTAHQETTAPPAHQEMTASEARNDSVGRIPRSCIPPVIHNAAKSG
ncbi:hypothetical protein [Lawsonella clevelandensis]|uniref:hypothetical protein n=1 Tax=Lawsonella clevelandensis TaxID=1528099 RepID=UPI0023F3FDDF|nr:hypothetical protein [Lawsonella clevelandensis]